MRVTRRLPWLGILAVLPACTRSPDTPISRAITCIREQVPEGRGVSIAKADSVLARCQTALDKWSRYSISGASGKPFSQSNPAMLVAFRNHQAAVRRYWMAELSPEYAKSHPQYDD